MNHIVRLEEDLVINNKNKKVILEKGDKIRVLEALTEDQRKILDFSTSLINKNCFISFYENNRGLTFSIDFQSTRYDFDGQSVNLTDSNKINYASFPIDKFSKIDISKKSMRIFYSSDSSCTVGIR